MAAATSKVTLEFHGFLAERLSALGRRRGTRTIVEVPLEAKVSVGTILSRLVLIDSRFSLLYDAKTHRLPEHVDLVLNDRLLDLQGGLSAPLAEGDVLTFLPAHAGGGA
jgi:molybdopterin converting factor small subunit